MIEQEIKSKYTSILQNLNVDKEFLNRLEKFISTYDGTNIKEFHLMLVSLLGILIELNEIKIKAKGYDELAGVKEQYDEEINKIAEQFEEVDSKLVPPVPNIP